MSHLSGWGEEKVSLEPVFRLSATQEVLGVSAITERIKFHIEGEFSGVWVKGEVSSLRKTAAGHTYFGLKEGDALLKAVLFRGRGRYFARHLSEGTEVVCYGDVTVYGPRGEYQLIVDFVEPAGLGATFAQLEMLKRRLGAEGLFDESRKKPIPPSPSCVALLTSHSGAALQDMLSILEGYPLPLQVLVYPIAAQGDEAPASIVLAFQALARHGRAEVAVLSRGGGSVEDLWAFNHESVVRAVADSKVPVITGIGHEVDTTLADLAADLRVPTPTAAAEVLVSNARELVKRFNELVSRMVELTGQRVSAQRARLGLLKAGLSSGDPRRRLKEQRLHLARLYDAMVQVEKRDLMHRRGHIVELAHRLYRSSPASRVERDRETLKRLSYSLMGLAKGRVRSEANRVGLLSERIKGLSPLAPLRRGYALCTRKGMVVRSAAELAPQDTVELRFLEDHARCLVLGIGRGTPEEGAG